MPYIFWPWFAVSVTILIRRRVGGGSWLEQKAKDGPERPAFPALAPTDEGDKPESHAAEVGSTTVEPGSVAVLAEPEPETRAAAAPPPSPPGPTKPADSLASRSLAEALEGISMPCDLTPLMGGGSIDPRKVVFFTKRADPTTAGAALAEELTRLGFETTTPEERTVRGERGLDVVKARVMSAALDSEVVMRELHPSAPLDALVVEVKLT